MEFSALRCDVAVSGMRRSSDMPTWLHGKHAPTPHVTTTPHKPHLQRANIQPRRALQGKEAMSCALVANGTLETDFCHRHGRIRPVTTT